MATTKNAQKSKEKPAPQANPKNQSLETPAYQRKGKAIEPAAPPTPAPQATMVADSAAVAAQAPAQPSQGVRMPTINEVRVAGRLTADPVIKAVGNQKVANFNVAVEKKYMDGQNQWQKQVSFVPVALWGIVADRASSFLHKGSPVYLEGRLRSSSWQTKDGQNRSMLRLEAFKIQSLAKGQSKSQSQGQEIGE